MINSNLDKYKTCNILYSNSNGFAGDSEITLLETICNYNHICIYAGRYGTSRRKQYALIPVKFIGLIGYGTFSYSNDCSVDSQESSYIDVKFVSDTKIRVYTANYGRLYSIFGIN